MYGLRQTIRESITALKNEDPQDNFEIIEQIGETHKVRVLWSAGHEEEIEIKLKNTQYQDNQKKIVNN